MCDIGSILAEGSDTTYFRRRDSESVESLPDSKILGLILSRGNSNDSCLPNLEVRNVINNIRRNYKGYKKMKVQIPGSGIFPAFDMI